MAPEALTLLADTAIKEVSHLYRKSHLLQLRAILDDPEARRMTASSPLNC